MNVEEAVRVKFLVRDGIMAPQLSYDHEVSSARQKARMQLGYHLYSKLSSERHSHLQFPGDYDGILEQRPLKNDTWQKKKSDKRVRSWKEGPTLPEATEVRATSMLRELNHRFDVSQKHA